MKILLISDREQPGLWDYYRPEKLRDIDLILSCGDLSPEYLRFLVTMGRAPVLYVHGNHDGRYEWDPPEGCDCIDGDVVRVKGLRILGLGGSMAYNGGPHQYTEGQMLRRILSAAWKLLLYGGADIVVTHAPIEGCGDGQGPHKGFRCFRTLAQRLRPAYWVHGHMHMSYSRNPRIQTLGDTTVINAYESYILEIK